MKIYVGYAIAIKANTDKERYAAVFSIAAGVLVYFVIRLMTAHHREIDIRLVQVFYLFYPIIPVDIIRKQQLRA